MITLWGRNNSTNVKKVLWTLEELDLPFNQIMAGMAFGVNKEAGRTSAAIVLTVSLTLTLILALKLFGLF